MHARAHTCTQTSHCFFFFIPLVFLFSVLLGDTHTNMKTHTHTHTLVDVASAMLHFVLHKLGLPRGEGSRLAMTA